MKTKTMIWMAMLFIIGCASRKTSTTSYGKISDFNLTAVTGGKQIEMARKDLSGRIWIADFIFTSCMGSCPTLSANMATLQAELPKQIGLLSFSVDPENDTPEALKEYSQRYKAEQDRWFFLTGKKSDVYKVIQDGFKLPAGEDESIPMAQRFFHSNKMVLLDSTGEIRGYYDGDEKAGIEKLKKDARLLLGK